MGQSAGSFLTANAPWLAAGALMTLMSSFGQTFFISIFAGHIQSEFSLSHGSWGSIYGAGTAAAAVAMIWVGTTTDMYRARHLGVFVLLALSASCLLVAWNPYAAALPILVFALRLTGQSMCSHIAIVAMSRWFVATRGKALAIATLGFAAGEITFPILFVSLMPFVHWRWLWVFAALICLFAIPLLRMFLRQERIPSQIDADSSQTGMDGEHWTRSSALRHPLFWCMAPAVLGPSAFGTALFFHQVHYAELKGISHLAFVQMLPLYTCVGIAAMLGAGWALDRYGTVRLIPYYQLPLVAAFLVFGLGSGALAIAVGFVLFGLTTGANATLPNAFWTDAYGTRHIGSIKSLTTALMVLGSAVGPALTGVLIDFGVSLDVQYIIIASYFAGTTLVMMTGLAQARSRFPERVTV